MKSLSKAIQFFRHFLKICPLHRFLTNPIVDCLRFLFFVRDFKAFKKLSRSRSDLTLSWSNRYPCLHDKTTSTEFDRHYIYHTAWAARIIFTTNPKEHVDLSSILYFSSLISSFVPVRFFDFRPPHLHLDNLECNRCDLTCLPFKDESLSSLSCMHVVEHIGLGRYGDVLDSNGDLKAIRELERVLMVGGSLLFVVPVGQPKIMYNAHRIYSFEQVMQYFATLSLLEFSLVPDDPEKGGIIRNANPCMVKDQTYACGCFHFTKVLV